ncbi:MAG: LysR substrate-binding domain-containing protein [Kiloniellales bacterium]|nr:LysR substrate-binding domain-containing protein [Kiloniellales bacterium]
MADDWLPSLNALRAFEAVSRHLSYRKAAEELHVTPAAVKQLVQKLEDTLGAPLIRRHGRRLRLTSMGEVGLSDLRGAFVQLSAAVQKMRLAVRRKTLTITVEPSIATAWLVQRLNGFKGKNPEVDVLIDSSMRVVDLRREAVDIAIRYGVQPDPDFVCHRLFEDEVLAVCSPALAAGPSPIRELQDLEKTTLLHIDLGDGPAQSPVTSYWFDWRTWLTAVGAPGVAVGQGLRFNDYNLAIQAAIAGQGVVLGSAPIVKAPMEAGLLVSPFAEKAKTGTGYDLVVGRERLERPEVASFIAWILDEVRPCR